MLLRILDLQLQHPSNCHFLSSRTQPSISVYLLASVTSLYLPLIPDIAILRERCP